MSLRKILSSAVAAALAGSALTLATSVPAHAAYTADPDDATFGDIASADVIGGGSDTSQHALKLLADAWNADHASEAGFRFITYAATAGGVPQPTSGSTETVPMPGATETSRPNGSGAGKGKLYGANEVLEMDFARSSSAQSSAETTGDLRHVPFALDTLVMVTSGGVPTNAPASLTRTQVWRIYSGQWTTWNQVNAGLANEAIVAYRPQDGSGTLSFFKGQMDAEAAAQGTTFAWGPNVQVSQEHDPAPITGNKNAIAPFSKGRASLVQGTHPLTVETGFAADRALYNAIRLEDAADPSLMALFGNDGFLCSNEARPLIEEAGFDQLARPANGGVCGNQTTAATTNFTLNEQVTTTTAVRGTSTKAGAVKVIAAVSGASSPEGTVDFYEGQTLVGEDLPLISGAATLDLTGQTPGDHTYTAVFAPGAAQFDASQGEGRVTVLAKATITESFPAAVDKGTKPKGKVTVKLTGVSNKATGKVKVKKGAKTIATGTLRKGVATITLPKLPVGTTKLKALWAGDAHGAKAQKAFTVKTRR